MAKISTDAKLFRILMNHGEREIQLGLVRLWSKQAARLTYDQIKKSVKNGKMPLALRLLLKKDLEEWSSSYLITVQRTVVSKVFLSRLKSLGLKLEEVDFSRVLARADKYLSSNSLKLVKGLSKQQTRSIRTALRLANSQALTPRSTTRLIKASVSLDARSYGAVSNRYAALIRTGASESFALAQSERYAKKLIAVRAKRIARTEQSKAVNSSDYQSMEEMRDEGLIKKVKAVWVTAEDERTCPVCLPLEGVKVDIGKEFESGKYKEKHPPLHPSCRCVLSWEAE